MLSTLTVGTALQIALIGAEYYARTGTHCPSKLVINHIFTTKKKFESIIKINTIFLFLAIQFGLDVASLSFMLILDYKMIGIQFRSFCTLKIASI